MGAFAQRRDWAGLTAFVLCLQLGCSQPVQVAQTALGPLVQDAAAVSNDAGLGPGSDAQVGPDGPATSGCPDTLEGRVSVTRVQLTRNIRYKLLGYDGFPFDERVAFAPARDGGGYVAWTDDATGRVLVTALNKRYERARPDLEANSYEIGGLVAQDDGFALLTLRDDPAASAGAERDANLGPVVMLVRYRNGVEAFAAALTGTSSITQRNGTAVRDSAPGYLYGRLAWNGAKYGAYFIIQAAPDDPQGPALTDKLVYMDDSGGALRGGFSGGCRSDEGLRMWPEPDVYTPICIADMLPAPGINLVAEDQPPLPLAPEASEPGWSGGQMGSIVKLSEPDNTYFVGWLSRGVVPGGAANQTARRANDIAFIRLGADRQVIGPKRWLVETQGVAETNLHFARYGQSRILMVWDTITDLHCDKMCFGTYAGTYARVLDREGNTIKEGKLSAVPNHHDDLVTLPNGDVAWAYVPDAARDYSSVPPSRDNVVLAPPKRVFQVARLRYCE